MKKLAIATLLVVAGCLGRRGGTGPVSAGGAESPRAAVERFVSAAKAQDYDGVSLIFGDASGPARATIPKTELEKREFVFMRCLRNDRYQFGSETVTPTGERVMAAQFWFKDLTATTNFTAVQGPNGRWYVRQFDVEGLQPICTSL